LNSQFLYHYSEVKSNSIPWNDIVLVVTQEESISLFVNNTMIQSKKFMPDLYHVYKSVAHLPLVLYSILNPAFHSPFTLWNGSIHDQLSLALHLVHASKAEINSNSYETLHIPIAQLSIINDVFEESIQFLKNILSNPNKNLSQSFFIINYIKPLREKLDNLVSFATSASLTSLHETLLAMLNELSSQDQQKKLYVAVVDGHMARKGNSIFQYFAAALESEKKFINISTHKPTLIEIEEGLETKVFYIEATSHQSHEQIMKFIAMHFADYTLGEIILGSGGGQRTHRDVLAPATSRLMQKWEIEGKFKQLFGKVIHKSMMNHEEKRNQNIKISEKGHPDEMIMRCPFSYK